MQCPKCNSDNTQRLSVIYQSGTQHISTTSRTYGGGGGSGFGVGGASTTTSGTSQSYLASKAAPPKKKPLALAIGIIVVGFLAFYVQFLLALLILAAGGFLAYKAFRYNKEVYPGLRQEWQRSWHCNKCGTIYIE